MRAPGLGSCAPPLGSRSPERAPAPGSGSRCGVCCRLRAPAGLCAPSGPQDPGLTAPPPFFNFWLKTYIFIYNKREAWKLYTQLLSDYRWQLNNFILLKTAWCLNSSQNK